ncbi:MAG: hypothetical protein R6U46_01350 [Marinilabilia sp.]
MSCATGNSFDDDNNGIIDDEKGNDNSEIDPYQPDDSEPSQEINGYRLVFNDEFNHEGPMKEEFWNAETGFRRNNEAQWYQAASPEERDKALKKDKD